MAEIERISVEEYRRLVLNQSAGKAPCSPKATERKARKRTLRPPRDASPRAIMARIMRRIELRNLKLQPEEQLAIAFADALRDLVKAGRLHAVWTHPANEIAGRKSGLSMIRYTIAKAMGLIDGTADYLFLWAEGSGVLEAKVGKNKQQDNQLDFEWWCKENGVHYEVFTSVEQGIGFLSTWGVIR